MYLPPARYLLRILYGWVHVNLKKNFFLKFWITLKSSKKKDYFNIFKDLKSKITVLSLYVPFCWKSLLLSQLQTGFYLAMILVADVAGQISTPAGPSTPSAAPLDHMAGPTVALPPLLLRLTPLRGSSRCLSFPLPPHPFQPHHFAPGPHFVLLGLFLRHLFSLKT